MVARVVVAVGHGGVEDHATEQFGAVGLRLVRPATQAVGQQGVGPAVPVQVTVAAIEHGQPTDQPEAQVALVGVVSVEALQHQHIHVTDRLQPRLGDVQAAAACELERGEFDALQVEAIMLGGKFAKPQALRVLDRGLRSCTAQAGPRIELFKQVRGDRPALLDRLGCRDQLSQLVRAVVVTFGRRWFGLQAKA